ncbi:MULTISPECIES: hydrogenase accessory protein [unclassified Bradyrhizobium]
MEFQPEKRDLTRLRPSEVGTASVAIGSAAADAEGTVAVLLSDGGSARRPKAIGIPILLPEPVDTLHGRLVGAVIARDAEGELDLRFGVRVQPRPTVSRRRETLGLIAKTKQIYIDRMSKLIGRPRANGTSVLKSVIP